MGSTQLEPVAGFKDHLVFVQPLYYAELSHVNTSFMMAWLGQEDNTLYWLSQGRPFTQAVDPLN